MVFRTFSFSPGSDEYITISAQSSKSSELFRSRLVSGRWLKFARKEVCPWDPALLTVRRIEHRRVHLCVGEEEGCGKYSEDGRGLSTMPVGTEQPLGSCGRHFSEQSLINAKFHAHTYHDNY